MMRFKAVPGSVVTLGIAALALQACSHASVSDVPLELPGVGTVYRYEGRANFSHQFAAADRAMQEKCKSVNGGSPVIVSAQKRSLGYISMGTGTTSTNTYATASGNTVSATTYGTVSPAPGMLNQNQELLFRCVNS